jgi:N-acetylmuramoyl-L-alanine amidase
MLKLTKMAACLIEMGSIDCNETARRISDPEIQNQFAEAVGREIEDYFNLREARGGRRDSKGSKEANRPRR